MKKIDPTEVSNVISNIKSYDGAMLAIGGIRPVNGILHSIDSLEQYVSDFRNEICPNLADPPAGYSWQVGIYPMAQKDPSTGIAKVGLYFIPTLAKDGFENMKPGDPDAANIILDYRVSANRVNYNENIVYIEDLGTSWP
jgi:hypothetical protein